MNSNVEKELLNNTDSEKKDSDKTDPAAGTDQNTARVISVNKDSFQIRKGEHDIFAELTGKMMFNAESPADLPTVGDWVSAQFYDNGTLAIIHEILPRKSLLKRKTAGKKNEYQLIAANIDTAFIVQSFGPDYNLRRLERYLVIVNDGDIQPVVLLSKSDLLPEKERALKIEAIRNLMPDIEIIEFSSISQQGIDTIKEMLIPEKTYCLLGSSGVGKTTLLNHLVDGETFETKAVREKDGKGRHTTTRRQLIRLKNSAMIIDTPGMRELGNIGLSAGIDETFKEIADLSGQCLFNDCTHTREKGCAILAALEEGTIKEERYQNFIKMNKESAYNEMSYLEKRRKDKDFGKMCRTVMKNKKNKW